MTTPDEYKRAAETLSRNQNYVDPLEYGRAVYVATTTLRRCAKGELVERDSSDLVADAQELSADREHTWEQLKKLAEKAPRNVVCSPNEQWKAAARFYGAARETVLRQPPTPPDAPSEAGEREHRLRLLGVIRKYRFDKGGPAEIDPDEFADIVLRERAAAFKDGDKAGYERGRADFAGGHGAYLRRGKELDALQSENALLMAAANEHSDRYRTLAAAARELRAAQLAYMAIRSMSPGLERDRRGKCVAECAAALDAVLSNAPESVNWRDALADFLEPMIALLDEADGLEAQVQGEFGCGPYEPNPDLEKARAAIAAVQEKLK
jgi:hypothetical protein